MSLPMMVSMLVQALYNVVDSVFVAKVNEAAMTAVSLATAAAYSGIGDPVADNLRVVCLAAVKQSDSKNTGQKHYRIAHACQK